MKKVKLLRSVIEVNPILSSSSSCFLVGMIWVATPIAGFCPGLLPYWGEVGIAMGKPTTDWYVQNAEPKQTFAPLTWIILDTLREKWLNNRYEWQEHPNSKLTKRDRFGNHTLASEHWTQYNICLLQISIIIIWGLCFGFEISKNVFLFLFKGKMHIPFSPVLITFILGNSDC